MKRQHLISRRLDIEELESRWVPSASVSTNWSGYAIDSMPGTVAAVSGSWIVPKVTGTGTSYSSAWVGIDGDNSSTVEQIGTDSDISNGKATYYAWYEMYPAGSVNLSLKVQPGDTIAASVSYVTNGFTLKITDGTQSYSITKKAASAERSSAEWIQEAPSSGNSILTLSDFTSITFSKAQTTISNTAGAIDNPAWASEDDQINMENRSGATIASTGSLTDSGSTSSFNVTYNAATSSTTTPTPPQRFTGFGSGFGFGFGGWGYFGWRQINMAASPYNDLSTASMNEVAQLSASPNQAVVSQPASVMLSSSVAPLGLTASFGQSGPGSLGAGYASASTIVGGAAEQLLVLPDMTPAGDGTNPGAAAPASPKSEPLPLLPMPTPLDQNKDSGTASETSLWMPAPQQMPPMIDQPEEERTAVVYPTNLGFGLALAGIWGLTRERIFAEQKRKSRNRGTWIREINWLGGDK